MDSGPLQSRGAQQQECPPALFDLQWRRKGLERNRHHIGANFLHEELGVDANILEAGGCFFEFKPGVADQKDKATKPPAFDVDDFERVVIVGLKLL